MHKWYINRCVFSALVLMFLGLATVAHAEQVKIGEVQTCYGTAAALAEGQKRPLTQRDPVYAKDTVVTGEDSSIQFMLKDGTVLALEANSMIEMRDFAYEVGRAEEGNVDLNMIAGGLRFLTGQVVRYNEKAFKVDTPLGTIGIRGTEGTVTTELSNQDAFANDLNSNLGAPGNGFNPGVRPDVTRQSVAHVNGSASKVMTFADRLGGVVSLSRGQAVDVSRDSGAGDPRDITPEDREKVKDVEFNKAAPTPTSYRSTFSGYAGGGRPSATAVEQSGAADDGDGSTTDTGTSSDSHSESHGH